MMRAGHAVTYSSRRTSKVQLAVIVAATKYRTLQHSAYTAVQYVINVINDPGMGVTAAEEAQLLRLLEPQQKGFGEG